MSLWEEFLNDLSAFAITAGIAGVVICPLWFFFRPRRLLPLPRLRQGNWSGPEVWLAFMLFLFVPGLAGDLLDNLGFFQAIFDKPPSLPRMAMWASPLAALLTLAFLTWFLFLMSRTRPTHLGITPARWPQNTVLGYLSFLVLTPLVLGLFLLVLLSFQQLFNAAPEPHALQKLSKESLMPIEWILLFFEAIVLAPLLEEIIFRGVLQGWLRRASFGGHVMMIAATLGAALFVFVTSLFKAPDQPAREANPGPLIFAVVMAVGYGSAVYRVWAPVIWERGRFSFGDEDDAAGPDPEEIKETGFSEVILPSPRPVVPEQHDGDRQRRGHWEKKNAMLAIFGSAMVFAALHSMVWPTPIPLFVLGIGLGFLAYRTQSLVAGFIVHSLFNTVACLVLVLPNVQLWLS